MCIAFVVKIFENKIKQNKGNTCPHFIETIIKPIALCASGSLGDYFLCVRVFGVTKATSHLQVLAKLVRLLLQLYIR